MSTPRRSVLVLYGPKAVGKSWVAEVAERRLGVHHVDADRLVLDLVAAGEQPDPVDGWLTPVCRRIAEELAEHAALSVEATGAWDSDWTLANALAVQGVRVLRVWVWTTKAEAMARLAARTAERAPVSVEEAEWIHETATVRAAGVRFDAWIDTGDEKDPERVVALLAGLCCATGKSERQRHENRSQPKLGPERL